MITLRGVQRWALLSLCASSLKVEYTIVSESESARRNSKHIDKAGDMSLYSRASAYIIVYLV